MKTSSNTSKRPARRTHRGQGMTEYIIIVALIAIGTIGTITLFGDNVRALFGMASDGLAGNTSVEKRTTSSKTANEKADLGTFAKKGNPY